MKTRSVTVRLPEDLIQFVNQRPGENFSDKLVRFLRNVSDENSDYLYEITQAELQVNNLYRFSQYINNLIFGFHSVLDKYYCFGYVDFDIKKNLQDLIDQIPSSILDGCIPFQFHSYGLSELSSPYAAPARGGNGSKAPPLPASGKDRSCQILKKEGWARLDLDASRFYCTGMTFEEYFVKRYGHSPDDYCVILQHTGLSSSQCQAFLTWEVGTFHRLQEQFRQHSISDYQK